MGHSTVGVGGKVVQAAAFARRTLAALKRDTQASVLPIMAAGLIPCMGMIGAGVDFGRVYLAQSKLQGAVDASALAAVRAKQVTGTTDADAEDVGEDYLRANFPIGYLGSTLSDQTVDVTEVDDVVTADVNASGTIRTALLRLVGLPTLEFGAVAQAQASDTLPTAVEALLVLDNTGSMRSGKPTRMSQLQTAARNFVDTIYGSNESRSGFAVGILPYNTMVNVGRLVAAAESTMGRNLVKDYPGFTDLPTTDRLAWKGCLFADQTIRGISDDPGTIDAGAYDIDDTMPGENSMPLHEPFIYPPIYVDSFQDINNRYSMALESGIWAIPTVKTALVRRFGNNICTDTSGTEPKCFEIGTDSKGNTFIDYTKPLSTTRVDFNKLPSSDSSLYVTPKFYNHYSGYVTDNATNSVHGASPNYQCPSEALPINYSATKTGLKNYIDNENFALEPGTGTFHNIAMTWAYRMMSRRDVFPRARPTNIPTRKVVIFMTDGNFDSRDDGREIAPKVKISDTAYTAYKTYEDRVIISTTSRSDTIEHLSRRFSKTCEAMKEDGIEIYTIAFALANNTEGNDTREMFRECATDRNTHFFSPATGAELNEAFVTIAAELVNLRLTR